SRALHSPRRLILSPTPSVVLASVSVAGTPSRSSSETSRPGPLGTSSTRSKTFSMCSSRSSLVSVCRPSYGGTSPCGSCPPPDPGRGPRRCCRLVRIAAPAQSHPARPSLLLLAHPRRRSHLRAPRQAHRVRDGSPTRGRPLWVPANCVTTPRAGRGPPRLAVSRQRSSIIHWSQQQPVKTLAAPDCQSVQCFVVCPK